jgi:hypothetical protein
MIFLDNLRPPSLLDPSAAGYKDWLHLNVLDHASGSVGLINVSLHGAPDDPRSRALGAALVHVPHVGWFGNIEIRGINEAAIGRASIGLERVALAVRHDSGTVMASVRDHDNALTVRLTATATAPPVRSEEQFPLGKGWISWYAVPRLTLAGEWTIGSERVDLQTASAYHDHNWGRWHWGDDLGWEWGCFLTPAPGATFILSRPSDRAHLRFGNTTLVVQAGGKRRTFSGTAVELNYSGVLQTIKRRVPGALAALHQDQAQLHLPKSLRIKADNGIDRVVVEFTAQAVAQLVAADPLVRGYGFIHEIAGEFTCSGMIGGAKIHGAGLGVLEHVY